MTQTTNSTKHSKRNWTCTKKQFIKRSKSICQLTQFAVWTWRATFIWTTLDLKKALRFTGNCSRSCRVFPPHCVAHWGDCAGSGTGSSWTGLGECNWCTNGESIVRCCCCYSYCSENLAHQVLPLRLMPLQMKVHAIGCQSRSATVQQCKSSNCCCDIHRQLAFNEDEWRHCLHAAQAIRIEIRKREKKMQYKKQLRWMSNSADALQVALLQCCTVAADLHAILPANLILIIIDNCGQQTQQKLTFIWLLCWQTRDWL